MDNATASDTAATEVNEPPLELSADIRRQAHEALDRWLDDCNREGNETFNSGAAGYFGRLVLCAGVADDDLSLRISRSFERDL